MVWKVMEIHGVWKGKIGMERMEWNWRKGKRNERKDGMEIGIWNLKGMTTHWEYKDLPITATIHSCACYWMNASPPLPAMLQAIALSLLLAMLSFLLCSEWLKTDLSDCK